MRGVLTSASSGSVAVGLSALAALTSGSGNTAVGYTALTANTIGQENTALGYEALLTNVDGDGNTAVGRGALRTMEPSDGAGKNTAVGGNAGYAVSTGIHNSFLGHSSGDLVSTGSDNTCIGYGSDGSANSASNQTVIGYGTTGVADNSVTLGNGDVTAVYMASDSGATVHADKYMSTTMPAFSVTPASHQTAFAENSATTIIFGTEIFDQGSNFASNTFTAPVTGKYQLNFSIQLKDIETAYDYYQILLITSNKTYNYTFDPDGFDSNAVYLPLSMSVLVDMDVSDTAYIQILAGGTGGGAGHDILTESYFSGYLVC
jgi:hypothetical protein